MNAAKPAATLFIDRDGTLVEEPPDEQVDSLEKVRFMPGVFAALADLARQGYRLVLVTNQDGLGTDSFPQAAFERPQQFILETFRSQGIVFDAVFICPHRKSDGCGCRKPNTGLVAEYIRTSGVDLSASAVVGDRDTDLQFAANLGVLHLLILGGAGKLVAQAAAIVIVTPLNFLGNRLWSFRHRA